MILRNVRSKRYSSGSRREDLGGGGERWLGEGAGTLPGPALELGAHREQVPPPLPQHCHC